MAHWERVRVPPDFTAMTSSERRGGHYRRYHPDLMSRAGEVLTPETLEYVYDVYAGLSALGERLRARPLPLLYATLVRSEAISSSWIEGERETPRNIMVAKLGDDRATHPAREVSRNIDIMRTALVGPLSGAWSHDDVLDVHHELVPRYGRGYRDSQVWVGGNTALTAQYAAPPAEKVSAYMGDLFDYANTSGDNPLAIGALVHAQFETIHPFPDGNGRVGRALFHAAINRGGVITGGVLPLSMALKEDVPGYVQALTAYRHDGEDPAARRDAVSRYTRRFVAFVEQSMGITAQFSAAVEEIEHRWREALSKHRRDSSVHRAAFEVLVEQPVVTAVYLQEQLGVTKMAAHTTLEALLNAEILRPAGGKLKRSNLYQATEILDLLDPDAAARRKKIEQRVARQADPIEPDIEAIVEFDTEAP
jgi:Fic family protein